jgi:DNA-binding MarR family transcriptional regulator
MTVTTVDAGAVGRLRASLIGIARRIDRQVSVAGLTSTEASILASIASRGPLGVGQLADREGINRTMLSRVIGKLEAADLVRRQPSIADRRAVEVVATRKGIKLRERLLADRSRLLAERLAELPSETVATILDAIPALDELANALEPKSL